MIPQMSVNWIYSDLCLILNTLRNCQCRMRKSFIHAHVIYEVFCLSSFLLSARIKMTSYQQDLHRGWCNYMGYYHRYTMEIPDLIYPLYMASSAMGSNLGSSGFYRPYTQKQMRPWSSRTVCHFTCVYLQAQTALDARSIHTWGTTVILITGKTLRQPI